MVVLVWDGPFGIANMIVKHHAVPLATSQPLIVVVRQSLVFLHQVIDGKAVAHGGGVVYL